ncbi:MAG TPA: lipopolysaccharide biosynthesis protein [Azospirillum sp.]|nr:lipopolysaccharide biosynthesis protein [Azospirillum sp.]
MTEGKLTHPAVVWAVVETAINTGASIAGLVLVARLLGPEHFGTAAMVVLTVEILSLLTGGLFIDALIQTRALEREHTNAAFWMNIATTAALAVALTLGAPAFARLMDEPALAAMLPWGALTLLAHACGAVPIALLRRRMRFRDLALRTLVARLASVAVGVGLAWGGFGAWALILQQMTLHGVGAASLWIMGDWRPGFATTRRHAGELLRFAGVWLGAEFVLLIAKPAFQLLIGALYGPATLGLVNLVFRAVETLWGTLFVAVRQLSMSVFARNHGDPDALRALTLRSAELSCFLLLPVFGGLAAAAHPLIEVVFSSQWLPAVPMFQALAVWAMLSAVLSGTTALFTATANDHQRFVLNLVDVGVGVVALAVFSGLGALAVGVVWNIRALVRMPVQYWMVSRIAGLNGGQLLAAVAPPMAAAFAGALLGAGVEVAVRGDVPPLVGLVAAAGGGTLAYLALLAVAAPRRLRSLVGAVLNRPNVRQPTPNLAKTDPSAAAGSTP